MAKDNRFTPISDAAFNAAYAAAAYQHVREYPGLRIDMAMTGAPGVGKVTHMRYVGNSYPVLPGAVRCNRAAA